MQTEVTGIDFETRTKIETQLARLEEGLAVMVEVMNNLGTADRLLMQPSHINHIANLLNAAHTLIHDAFTSLDALVEEGYKRSAPERKNVDSDNH